MRCNPALMALVADEAAASAESLRKELSDVETFGVRPHERHNNIARMMTERPRG